MPRYVAYTAVDKPDTAITHAGVDATYMRRLGASRFAAVDPIRRYLKFETGDVALRRRILRKIVDAYHRSPGLPRVGPKVAGYRPAIRIASHATCAITFGVEDDFG